MSFELRNVGQQAEDARRGELRSEKTEVGKSEYLNPKSETHFNDPNSKSKRKSGGARRAKKR